MVASVEKARPFIKWAGGKTALLPELTSRMPQEYGKYFEPFLGGGALYWEVNPGRACLNDIGKPLINSYQEVRDNVEKVIGLLEEMPYEKEFYLSVRALKSPESLTGLSSRALAARFIYLNRACYNGLYRENAKGLFNVPFGRYKNPTICNAPLLRACSGRLQNCELTSQSFLDIEPSMAAGDFVYFDPPYLKLEKGSFTRYHKSDFGVAEHQELADMLQRLDEKGAFWMLSNSYTPESKKFYEDAGWYVEQVKAPRSINSKGGARGKVSELIVRNYGRL